MSKMKAKIIKDEGKKRMIIPDTVQNVLQISHIHIFPSQLFEDAHYSNLFSTAKTATNTM